ncbi:DUF1223 domain-containing protein [Emcibacter sp. SYSU 3D8]|uniref:DUF1223 domain-containing protein n=1 Tax=Emcibacter sp. SYSU 3D8 TaxID=3133969 RepID=UPI0031FEACFF
MSRKIRAGLAALAIGIVLAAGPASATAPVVVELFTSQGCSSCPPADALLATLSERPGIVALSFGVTYWDKLGWKDTFASREYTRRQHDYAATLGKRSVFTPQIVVNGRADAVGSRRQEVDALIDAARRQQAGPAVTLSAKQVTIGPGRTARAADVWLVRYEPRIVQVAIRRGENGGRTLPHRNVVRSLVRLGGWTGETTVMPLPPAPPGLRTAVLVQMPDGGPILSAASR